MIIKSPITPDYIIAQGLQQYLAQNPHPKIRVFDCGAAGMEVMFQARGSEK
ncbi:MAG: hypothetical protein ACKO2T_25960 [Microcystis aeruginosa]